LNPPDLQADGARRKRCHPEGRKVAGLKDLKLLILIEIFS
jgi:hypothetical protein